ncbi:hypothetical protein CYMTET_44358 [Cymbomonas tetramitiformis]|uniref:Uncharacterized protein n=1 Tax=Cymbomonas tetramitiformis TaxID=36881 RepID=A0AAE0C0G3_9CHLO|nr:hypothetical protein CYMTET_44358 [Cymbomonas tetramitiformis]|eukprot:gene145-263_t
MTIVHTPPATRPKWITRQSTKGIEGAGTRGNVKIFSSVIPLGLHAYFSCFRNVLRYGTRAVYRIGLNFTELTVAFRILRSYSLYLRVTFNTTPRSVSLPSDALREEALCLFRRKNALTTAERTKYETLLKEMDRRMGMYEDRVFMNANKLYADIVESDQFKDAHDREGMQEIADLVFFTGNKKTIDDCSTVEMAVSKALLHKSSEKSTTNQSVCVLAAMYQEQERLKPLSETLLGEDFLRKKIRQLRFLFDDVPNFEWSLVFVEDEPEPLDTRRSRTCDAIRSRLECMQSTGEIRAEDARRVHVLTYEDDLQEEIKMYKDPSYLEPQEFARLGVKAGAIHTGLRYLARVEGEQKQYKTPKFDVLMYTDCDTSVNLANSGILINALEGGACKALVGSRRTKNSTVIGKSKLRYMQSYVYNVLVRALLNVQITDTQVGCKVLLPEVVLRVHEEWKELSMAFDAELLRTVLKAGYEVREEGILWIDSDLDSKSADQALPMYNGVWNIFNRIPAHETDAIDLMREPEFSSVMRVATDEYFAFFVRHLKGSYDNITPVVFKEFTHWVENSVVAVFTGCADADDTYSVLKHGFSWMEDMLERRCVDFLMKHLIDIGVCDLIQLVKRNPRYWEVLVPMLFGTNDLISLLGTRECVSYYDFIHAARVRVPSELSFASWLADGARPPRSVQSRVSINGRERSERIATAKNSLSRRLSSATREVKVCVAFYFNMDRTTEAYVEKVLVEKMRALKEEFVVGIVWEVLLVDGRHAKTSGIESYMKKRLAENSVPGKVIGGFVEVPDNLNKDKGSALRYAMSETCDRVDFVGYADFSDKIDIREMLVLLNRTLQNEGITVGTRRSPRSAVSNKPIPMLLRSTALNVLVKTLFPRLFHLSDTQTGFKLFYSEAWKLLRESLLVDTTLAFDVEILQTAARLGLTVAEEPVDFMDASQNTSGFGEEEQLQGMFDACLRLRGEGPDTSISAPSAETSVRRASLLAGGAENVVYTLDDGSLVKIPHEVVAPFLMGFLRYVLFKDREVMNIHDRADGLVTTGLIGRLISSDRLRNYVPTLRAWTALNIFVMRIITSYEKKAFKSIGYEVSYKYGEGLIVPYRFVTTSCELVLEGEYRIFGPTDGVKQSVVVAETVKDRIARFISNSHQIAQDVCRVIADYALFLKRLWRRGLFDLDTNMLYDVGYYDGKLMVLDPGEMIDDLRLIDIETARLHVSTRYDYVELTILLQDVEHSEANKILHEYVSKMKEFLDEIEKDVKTVDTTQREFGRDVRERGAEHFELQFPTRFKPLRSPSVGRRDKYEGVFSSFRRSAYNYQYAYSPKGMPPIDVFETFEESPAEVPRKCDFLHVVGTTYDGTDEDCTSSVESGSVGPLWKLLKKSAAENENRVYVLDAGKATRSSLLKFGQANYSKGSVILQAKNKRPLYKHAASSAQKILERLRYKLDNDFVVLASSDDFTPLQNDSAQISRIVEYFTDSDQLVPAPGFYWCDLPDAGRRVLPMTKSDMVAYFKGETANVAMVAREVLRTAPFFEGALRNISPADMHKSVGYFVDLANLLLFEDTCETDKPTSTSYVLPWITGIVQQFIQSRAELTIGGTKTPFLMIFQQAFLQEFLVIFERNLSRYSWDTITWENLLCRAMKTDRFVWNKFDRPGCMSNGDWNSLFDELRALKYRYNINTDALQNGLRVYAEPWQNLDDPAALFRLICQRKLEFDERFFDSGTCNDRVVYVNTDEKIKIEVAKAGYAKSKLVADKSRNNVLVYNVQNVDLSSTIRVPPDHVLIEVSDNEATGQFSLYSTFFGEYDKKIVSDSMVYGYTLKDNEYVPDIELGKMSDFTRRFEEKDGVRDRAS